MKSENVFLKFINFLLDHIQETVIFITGLTGLSIDKIRNMIVDKFSCHPHLSWLIVVFLIVLYFTYKLIKINIQIRKEKESYYKYNLKWYVKLSKSEKRNYNFLYWFIIKRKEESEKFKIIDFRPKINPYINKLFQQDLLSEEIKEIYSKIIIDNDLWLYLENNINVLKYLYFMLIFKNKKFLDVLGI